jgi:hypothetical protein
MNQPMYLSNALELHASEINKDKGTPAPVLEAAL